MARAKQRVVVEVFDTDTVGANPIEVFEGLRIDFDIRHIPDFSRGTVTFYNLNDRATRSLMSGERWINIKVGLGGRGLSTIANMFYVNNATDVVELPNRIVKLFMFDNLKRSLLENQITEHCKVPSLKVLMEQVLKAAGHTGDFHFQDFPHGLIEDLGLRRSRSVQGSVQKVLRQLETEFRFKTFTVDGAFKFMYSPDEEEVGFTDLANREAQIVLKTNAMVANPVIGIASAKVHSNLDTRIKPGLTLDFSQLLTVEAGADEGTLTIARDFLDNFSGYSKYQAFAVTHKGSSYTKEWSTLVDCIAPSKGTLMPTVAWANIN